jgi:hypothetical protein
MKIRYGNNSVQFSDLKQGDVFKYASDVYLRVDLVTDEDQVEWNTVNLATGSHESFSPETNITPCPKAELTLG